MRSNGLRRAIRTVEGGEPGAGIISGWGQAGGGGEGATPAIPEFASEGCGGAFDRVGQLPE